MLSACEENGEVGDRIPALSPAWPALCQSPPSSPELHPVRDVHPRCESSRESPLMRGEKAVDFRQQRETQNRCPAQRHPCQIVALL